MSIVVTTNQPTQETPPAQSAQAQSIEAEVVDKSSTEVQGETEESAAKEDAANSESESAEQLVTENQPPKKKSGVQRLKERMAREAAEHAREKAEIRKEIESLRSQVTSGQRQEEQSTSQAESSGEPLEENFESYKDYVKALAKYTYAQEKAQDEKKSKEAQASDHFQSQVKKHNERVEKFKAENPDYTKTVEEFIDDHGDVSFSLPLQQEIFESEMGPAIINELLKRPDEFTRLNALGPVATAREVARIEARLARQETPKTETKQTTKAPPPPTPLSGKSDKATKKSIYDEGLSQSDYEKLRREQMKDSWGA